MKFSLVALLIALSFISCSEENQTNAQQSPNIILIISDDLGWDAFGNLAGANGEKANTPTLDSLAGKGLTFTNFWVNPVCAPTRAAMLTGKYAFRTGVGGVQAPQTAVLPTTEKIIHQYITDQTSNGYANALIGKWHVSKGADITAPEDFGVQYYSGFLIGTVSDYYNWTQTSAGVQQTINTYTTTHFVDQSIAWIDDQTKPFFLWLAVNAPHAPFHRPPLSLISNQSLSTSQTEINANPLPYYLASIEALDSEIKRLINGLTKTQKDNTIFIFMGDNGTPQQVAQSPFSVTKSTLFQGGINTPLLVCGKGITRQNETENALIQAPDMFATLAEMAGVDITSYQDGRSFLALCQNSNATKRDYVYTEQFGQDSPNDGYAIRNHQYKLIHLESGTEYLYDLLSDPFETTNLLTTTLSTQAQENYNSLKAIKSSL